MTTIARAANNLRIGSKLPSSTVKLPLLGNVTLGSTNVLPPGARVLRTHYSDKTGMHTTEYNVTGAGGGKTAEIYRRYSPGLSNMTSFQPAKSAKRQFVVWVENDRTGPQGPVVSIDYHKNNKYVGVTNHGEPASPVATAEIESVTVKPQSPNAKSTVEVDRNRDGLADLVYKSSKRQGITSYEADQNFDGKVDESGTGRPPPYIKW